MSQVAFIVDVPDYAASAFADTDFLSIGIDATRQVRQQLAVGGNVTLASVAVATEIVIDPDIQASVVAGDVAGTIAVDGVTTASVIISVIGILNADQTQADFTEEFGGKDGVIDNTGGSDTSDYQLAVVWR